MRRMGSTMRGAGGCRCETLGFLIWKTTVWLTPPKKISMVSMMFSFLISFHWVSSHFCSVACPWITTTSYFWMSFFLAKHQVAGVEQIYSSAPWPFFNALRGRFCASSCSQFTRIIRSIYFWKLPGLRNYVVPFFPWSNPAPFLGKSPPWLAFLDDIPCVMFLWGGYVSKFLGKSHGVKGSIPR